MKIYLNQFRLMFFLLASLMFMGLFSPAPRVNAVEKTVIVGSTEKIFRFTSSSMKIIKGNTMKLPYISRNLTNKDIIWTSSNKKVAKVTNGKVKILKKGTATIKAIVRSTGQVSKIKVTGVSYYYVRVKTTGYCNCRSCNGKWAYGRTASGKWPRARHTVAVDPNYIKLGTKIQIGNTTYVAEDTGSGVKGWHLDIYYKTHKTAQNHGVRYITVKVFR